MQPIKFLPRFVPKLLDGTKTHSRRLIKPQPSHYDGGIHRSNVGRANNKPAPYLDAYCTAKSTEHNPRGMSEHWCWWSEDDRQGPDWIECPFGKPGDILWVQEPWTVGDGDSAPHPDGPYEERIKPTIHFQADWSGIDDDVRWMPAEDLPKWASRLSLLITSIRIERIQAITKGDVIAEGYEDLEDVHAGWHQPFAQSWESIYPGSWDRNDWVWALTFKRVESPQ